jgi:hypothetical protein
MSVIKEKYAKELGREPMVSSAEGINAPVVKQVCNTVGSKQN